MDTDAAIDPAVRVLTTDAIRVHESSTVTSQWTQLLPDREAWIDIVAGATVKSDVITLFGRVNDAPIRRGAAEKDGKPYRAELTWVAVVTRLVSDARGYRSSEAVLGLYEVNNSGKGTDGQVVLDPLGDPDSVAPNDRLRVRFVQFLSRGAWNPAELKPEDGVPAEEKLWERLFGIREASSVSEEATEDARLAPRFVSRAFEVVVSA
jgi:hypothetical protein